jgi:carboxypeptidase PM20D1
MILFKRCALGLVLALVTLVAVMGVNTWRKSSQQLAESTVAPVTVDAAAAAKRLAGSIPFKTVSQEVPTDAGDAEFKKLHAYLAQQFPLLHASLRREAVGHSLLYTWAGTDPKALPIAILAHQDVVPIASGTEKTWAVDPFGGVIQDGFVWGRGTLDDKGNIVAQMEAIELLLASGFKPRQTIYLALGHDEEIGGMQGNQAVVALLVSRGVKLDFVLDEGMVITEGVFPGLAQPLALIGLAEKGGVSLGLSYDGKPGHSSMPTVPSAIGSMAQALAKLEARQMPGGIQGVAAQMFAVLAPEMPWLNRVLLSNLWLTAPLVQAQLEKSAAANAMLRTTTALTIVNGGNKANVLPGHVDATVNFRLLPGDTIAGVHEHVAKVVGNEAIQIKLGDGREASPISPSHAAGYQMIAKTVRQLFPGVIVAPGLVIAGTDSRLYTPLTDNIYRFSPMRFKSDDLARLHGTNERIPIANYVEVIQFYHQLLRNL